MHNVEAMRGDLAGVCPRHEGDASACSPIPPACRNICRRRWPPFLPSIAHVSIDVEERESADIAHAIATGAADLGLAAEHALPDSIERIPFSEDRLVLVAARGDELANRRQVDFREVVDRDFVGLTTSSALHAHIAGHAARLGARLRFRARLNNFDAIGQMVAAGIGIAVMPEVAAQRCARSMRIGIGPDSRSLGQPQARDLRPQLQGAAAAGAATGGAFAQSGAVSSALPLSSSCPGLSRASTSFCRWRERRGWPGQARHDDKKQIARLTSPSRRRRP